MIQPSFFIKTDDGDEHRVSFGKPRKLSALRSTRMDYDPEQDRDGSGRWTSGGGESAPFSGPNAIQKVMGVKQGQFFKHNTSGESVALMPNGQWKATAMKSYVPVTEVYSSQESALRAVHNRATAEKPDSHQVPAALQNRTSVETGGGSVLMENKSGRHGITTASLDHALESGSFSVFTAANPMGEPLPFSTNMERNKKLAQDLKAAGAIIHDATGIYTNDKGVTTREPSFMVHHTKGVDVKLINELAAKYGQESALHYTLGHTTIRYTGGEKKGEDMLTLNHYTRKPAADVPQTYVKGAGKFAMDWRD